MKCYKCGKEIHYDLYVIDSVRKLRNEPHARCIPCYWRSRYAKSLARGSTYHFEKKMYHYRKSIWIEKAIQYEADFLEPEKHVLSKILLAYMQVAETAFNGHN